MQRAISLFAVSTRAVFACALSAQAQLPACPLDAAIQAVTDRTGRLGHLIKADLASHAAGDGFTAADPASVALDWRVAYFTNHGLPVHSARATLACCDALFRGDCRANRGFIFVGWDFRPSDGSPAGTGTWGVLRAR